MDLPVLADLALIFVLALLTGRAVVAVGLPAVVGEVALGMIIGPYALGWVADGDALRWLADIAIVVLLFEVGLENRWSDLRNVGRTATAVAVVGMFAPLLGGAALLLVLGHDPAEATFLGAALVATSVGVTARVFRDLGMLRHRAAQTVVTAAVIDDVLGLLTLATVSVLAALSAGSTPHVPIAEAIRVFAIVLAFIAGMSVPHSRRDDRVARPARTIMGFLVPFFFVGTGMSTDLGALAEGRTLTLGVAVVAVALATKVVPCAFAARALGRREALMVGVGMVPRAEVGIIVASIGLSSGILDRSLHGVVVAMALVTTLVAPPLLRVLARPRGETTAG